MNWSIALKLVHRHAYLSIRLLVTIVSLLMMWACVILALTHHPVWPYAVYHPGEYAGFFKAWMVLHMSFAQSQLVQWLHGHLVLGVMVLLMLYVPIHLYSVIELIRSQFDRFTIQVSQKPD